MLFSCGIVGKAPTLSIPWGDIGLFSFLALYFQVCVIYLFRSKHFTVTITPNRFLNFITGGSMSSGLYEIELYGGLFMFMAYIVFDTQVGTVNLLEMLPSR